MQMLNKWGTVNLNNYDKICQNTKKYGHQRLLLGLYLSKILDQLKVLWWLDTGSLLGAYREGKMIAHDDDFDIGVLTSAEEFQDLFEKISETVNAKFKTRIISTYSMKIQIFDPESGSYYLDHVHHYTLYNVTVNLQLYTYQPNHRVKMMYFRHNLSDYIPLIEQQILPLSRVEYCGHYFNAPHKIQGYLETHYGYIGIGAIYNSMTRKYEDKKEISKKASTKADQGNHDDLKYQ